LFHTHRFFCETSFSDILCQLIPLIDLGQRICAGIKQAFHFQRNVYSDGNNESAKVTALIAKSDGPKEGWETIFDAVVKESAIRNKKAQRQGLLKGIISLFEKDPDAKNSNAEQLPMLAFASEILGNLPYTSLSDPLFIVYHSSCIAALDGQGVLTQFAELLGGDVCDPNSEEDDIEKSSNQGKFNAAELGLEAKGAEFGQLCVEAARILPLLKLKQFLRKAYNISEARVTSYVPSEKELIHEKGISIADGPPFSFTMKSILDADGNINWCNAVQIYSSFRKLMRDAEADDVHVDLEPTKSPKRKRKHSGSSDQVVEESPKVSPEA
jgi:cohesin loading factor subunit SCC2